MERVLVIGYGNPLRSDDGMAWRAAERLRQQLPETSRVMCVQQLTPEIAEDVALAEVVIFLDACSTGEPGRVRCETVRPQPDELRFSHHLTPSEVLTLSEALYSAKPRAFLVSIRGEYFDHGESLSPLVLDAMPQVVSRVVSLVKQLSRDSELAVALSSSGSY